MPPTVAVIESASAADRVRVSEEWVAQGSGASV